MRDRLFETNQGGRKLGFEATSTQKQLFGVLDELSSYVAVMDNAMTSVAEELKIAEISDAFAAALYFVVKKLMHTQGITA